MMYVLFLREILSNCHNHLHSCHSRNLYFSWLSPLTIWLCTAWFSLIFESTSSLHLGPITSHYWCLPLICFLSICFITFWEPDNNLFNFRLGHGSRRQWFNLWDIEKLISRVGIKTTTIFGTFAVEWWW